MLLQHPLASLVLSSILQLLCYHGRSPVQQLHIANSNYQAEVGLLSRFITIQGAMDSQPSDPDPGDCTGEVNV